ncbi:MAG: Ppx/GppA family phosphatase [Balneolaceae bacterium]|nr:Ppx/GppA family phosphatase [Balneolaceae bacterium]
MNAAIDIGTNTVLLLVAEKDGNNIKVIYEAQRMPRLGKGVDEDRVINDKSMERVIRALSDYKEILDAEYPEVESITVTATSAVRDATNREEFLQRVKKETGFNIRVLSGIEEAVWTATGALSTLNKNKPKNALIIDIGGGSTELAIVKDGKMDGSYSYNMGSVRFTERFLIHNPPYQEEILACEKEIETQFNTNKFKVGNDIQAVGVAGTMISLAAIDLQIENYERQKVNGHCINSNKLYKSIEIFSLHTYEELLELSPEALRGREDIFLAGLLILKGFLQSYALENIVVSAGGIRHGAILKG